MSDLKKLRASLENPAPLYLFYGEEAYLRRSFTRTLIEKTLPPNERDFNLEIFDGKENSPREIHNAVKTPPFLGEKRMVLARYTGLFAQGRQSDSAAMLKFLDDIPGVLLFIEEEVDKRTALYKAFAAREAAWELNTPASNDLLKWSAREFKIAGYEISVEALTFFLAIIENNMDALEQERKKLIAYCFESKKITIEDIRAICVPTPEARIFEMLRTLCEGNVSEALKEYHILLRAREEPLVILSMFSRQFRLLLGVSELSGSDSEVARILGVRDFALRELKKQAKNYTIARLESALFAARDTDVAIKTGKIEAKTGIETLLIEFGKIR